MISVNHFSTYSHGGATMAARRIADGFDPQVIQNQFYYRGESVEDGWQPLAFREPRKTFWYRKFRAKRVLSEFQTADEFFQTYLATRPENAPTYSPARSFWTTFPERTAIDADILHMHWVAFLFDYPTFFQSIPNHQPIVWTLHDMNPFTGGCHYSSDCQRFESGCGQCPQLTRPGQNDISEFSYRHKRNALKGKSLEIVAPSRWLLEQAQRSKIFPAQTGWHHINYGLDTGVFSPLVKEEAKQKLGLETDRPVILFGAQDVDDPRKGFTQLEQALALLSPGTEAQIAVFGKGVPQRLLARLPTKQLGYLDTDLKKQTAYSAADLFVLPSLEDNQPQTGLEAMACETPVVAFRAGGIPEFVLDGQTGLLADVGESSMLAQQISRLILDDQLRRRLGQNSRGLICRNFEAGEQTLKYVQLYQSALGRTSYSRKVA